MREHFPHQHEKHEQLPLPEKAEARVERHEHETHHKAEHKDHDIEAIHKEIEEQAKKAEDIKVDKAPEKHSAEHYLVTKGLKQEAFKRSLQRVRKQMKPTSRNFSKVIHQPAVDFISKVGEKTVARPTGILTGAIIALAGTSYLLWSAKHYGYQYNYLVFIILFAGGYILGLVLETLIYISRRLRGNR